MASILFVTLYDEYCLGVRQLIANLRQAGHDARLLAIKQYGKKTIEEGEQLNDEWQVELMPNGSRSVLCYPFPITDKEYELIRETMQTMNPDVVGFSVYSPQIERTVAMTQTARDAVPESIILWGGPHATLNPDASTEYADYVMVGEGDVALVDFLNAIDTRGDLKQVGSLAWREADGTVVKTPLAPLVDDLDTLPFTYHGEEGIYYLDNDKVTEGVPFPTSDLMRSHKLMTSRGCPYACTYCMLSYQKEVMPESTKLRYRSIEHVIKELETMRAKLGHFFCEIEDDIFTLRPERMEDFFDEYRARVDMPFWCYTHPQYARPAMLKLLKENNAQFVVMGVESGSDRVANEVFNRKVKMQTLVDASERISESGLRAYYDLISNNPFETDADRIETFHLIRSLKKPFELQLVELNFYPNIQIDRMRKEAGLPPKVDFQQFRFWNALYHLASVIDISDADAEYYLNEPSLRKNPQVLEGLAKEAKRLHNNLGDAQIWNKTYQREIELQASRAKEAEERLHRLEGRKGVRQVLWLSEKVGKAKRRFAGDGAYKDMHTPHTNQLATAGAGKKAPGQFDVVTEVMAPLDYREGDRGSR